MHMHDMHTYVHAYIKHNNTDRHGHQVVARRPPGIHLYICYVFRRQGPSEDANLGVGKSNTEGGTINQNPPTSIPPPFTCLRLPTPPPPPYPVLSSQQSGLEHFVFGCSDIS